MQPRPSAPWGAVRDGQGRRQGALGGRPVRPALLRLLAAGGPVVVACPRRVRGRANLGPGRRGGTLLPVGHGARPSSGPSLLPPRRPARLPAPRVAAGAP